MSARTLYWRRLDTEGLERVTIACDGDALHVQASIIAIEDGGFQLDHQWVLSPDWSVRSLSATRWGGKGQASLRVQRTDAGWSVDGQPRPDLDGAEQVDLSATPLCNTFALRPLMRSGERTRELDVAYVDAATLQVTRSRQAYDRLDDGRFRYRDLGLFAGFQAVLQVQDEGLVRRYEGLFEQVL
ncbi:putative glycolipid-binding domain-containing protein [Orrella sp. JC864]|uniref:putative glycolipid-binding domain-containing protein n=1 Tax=Orrella sp. JC864 TaxID=3120298 RepID=UPI00300A2F2C